MSKEEIAENLLKAAAGGAAFDVVTSVLKRRKAKQVVKDAGCGATTATVGAGTTMAYRHFLPKHPNTFSLMAGTAASVAVRHIYRDALGKVDKVEEKEEGEGE